MSLRLAHCLVWASSVLLAGPPSAYAQEAELETPEASSERGAAPENLDATREAREHFRAGLQHFQSHQYREAIQSFELAARLVPSADLSFNIARAHEELSEYDQAIEAYQHYLRDRVDPPDRAQIEARIEALRARAEAERAALRSRPTAGTLRLTTNRDGAAVQLDGSDAGTSPWAEPRELQAGRHGLSVTREGYVPFRSEVSIERGLTTAAYADLLPETNYVARRSDPVFAWIVWGAGVASLAGTIGLGIVANDVAQRDLSQARTLAAFSDGLLAGTIGLAIVGLVLWFVEGQSVGTERVRVDEGESGVRGPS